MNIKNIYTRKNIIYILVLILGGLRTNKEIADELKKHPATSHEQLIYLKDKEIIYLLNDDSRQYNEKEYEVSTEKISELFFKRIRDSFNLKTNLSKFKSNELLRVTIAGLIFSKKDRKDIKEITLGDIYSDFIKFLMLRGIILKRQGNALEGFKVGEKAPKNTAHEFKELLNIFADIYDKETEKVNDEFIESVKKIPTRRLNPERSKPH